MSGSRSQYESILDTVTKPGRYIGNERGSARKDVSTVSLRFALAFPEVYEIAQSHPGLQILYDLLNRRSDTYAERVFAPWTDMEAALRRAKLPLSSLETRTPLRNFDIVGFSLQYELSFTNLLMMLDLGGVPLLAAERSRSDPLVIAGGPCAFNPEPLADFLDAVLLGDGEEAIHEICNVYLTWDRGDRETLLVALSQIPGVYIPAFFEPEYHSDGGLRRMRPRGTQQLIEKRIVADLDAIPSPATFIVPSAKIVHDRPSVEVMRGCVKGCRFCQAGYIYRPVRERHPKRVLAQAEDAIRETGYEELSLLSLSTGDYSCINPLVTEIMNRFAPSRVALSLPSTRVDALAAPLLEQIKRVRKTGFTLAPEAGTQRLRDVIQKQYTEEDLIQAVSQVFALGWRSLKLYFMLGLPSETDEDLRGIATLSGRVAAAGQFRRQVTASVSNFVPKPHTPFQWLAQLPASEMSARQEFLKRELTRRRVKFKWHDVRESYLEGILSRGDRRLGRLLLTAYRLGCRFDGWGELLRFDLWQQAWQQCGIDPDSYLRRRRLDEVLPWDHLSGGVAKSFLRRELARAFERLATPDCSLERCAQCGVCDFTRIRNVTYHLRGAAGADHRGGSVDGWASAAIPGSGEGAWEPRGWHMAEATRAGSGESPRAEAEGGAALSGDCQPAARSAVPKPSVGETSPAPEPSPRHNGTRSVSSRAEGTAEAWIDAPPRGLASAVEPTPRAPAARIRIVYAKLGDARFLGHLELGTLFLRAARRAGLPLAFSRGHHPLPRFAFGPALPLGVESDGEYLDLEITESCRVEDVRARLNAQMPAGIDVFAAAPLPARAPSIDAQIMGFRFRVDLGGARPLADLDARIAAFLAAPQFPLRKHHRTGDKTVDARPLVGGMALCGAATIEVVIAFGPRGTLKPGDLVAAVLGLSPEAVPRLRVRKVETLFRHLLSTAGAGARGLPR